MSKIKHRIQTHEVKAAGFFMSITSSFKNEAAFRQRVFIAAVVIPLAFYLKREPGRAHLNDCCRCISGRGRVDQYRLGGKAVVDRIGTEHHELAGMAKDAGSAVLSVRLSGLCLARHLFL